MKMVNNDAAIFSNSRKIIQACTFYTFHICICSLFVLLLLPLWLYSSAVAVNWLVIFRELVFFFNSVAVDMRIGCIDIPHVWTSEQPIVGLIEAPLVFVCTDVTQLLCAKQIGDSGIVVNNMYFMRWKQPAVHLRCVRI